MSLKRHELFYWDFVTFQVDDTLYKVPKQQFMTGSPFFRDLFQLPQSDGTVEGKDDEHPIRLPGEITKDEFEILIRAVCSSTLGEDFQDFSKDDWMCCLKLATMWDFKSLRKLSIDHLGKDYKFASDADRVALGVKFRVPGWIIDGATELVTREKLVLTSQEKELLGMEAALHLFEIREELHEEWRVGTQGSCGHSPAQMFRKSKETAHCGYCRTIVTVTSPTIERNTTVVKNNISKRFAME